jgi:hypothetical protein
MSFHRLKASDDSGTAEYCFTIFDSEKRHESVYRCATSIFHYIQTKITDSVHEDQHMLSCVHAERMSTRNCIYRSKKYFGYNLWGIKKHALHSVYLRVFEVIKPKRGKFLRIVTLYIQFPNFSGYFLRS